MRRTQKFSTSTTKKWQIARSTARFFKTKFLHLYSSVPQTCNLGSMHIHFVSSTSSTIASLSCCERVSLWLYIFIFNGTHDLSKPFPSLLLFLSFTFNLLGYMFLAFVFWLDGAPWGYPLITPILISSWDIFKIQ